TNGNYVASYVAGTLTVDAKAATVTANHQSKTYGGVASASLFRASGLESGDNLAGVSCTVSGAHSAAGTYSISSSGNNNSNYAASYVAGTLTVDAKAATVTADAKSKTYGGADPAFTFQVSGLESGDSLTGVSCGVSSAHSAAGTYSISRSEERRGGKGASYGGGRLSVKEKEGTVT